MHELCIHKTLMPVNTPLFFSQTNTRHQLQISLSCFLICLQWRRGGAFFLVFFSFPSLLFLQVTQLFKLFPLFLCDFLCFYVYISLLGLFHIGCGSDRQRVYKCKEKSPITSQLLRERWTQDLNKSDPTIRVRNELSRLRSKARCVSGRLLRLSRIGCGIGRRRLYISVRDNLTSQTSF